MRKGIINILFLLLACSKDASVLESPAISNYAVTVSASEGGSVNSTGGSYAQNATITLTATAAEGFVFSGWSGDATGTTNPLTYSVTANASVIANFIRSNYSLNVQSSGQGSVAQELVSSAKSKTDYESGSTVRLTAIPESDWLFYRWEGLSKGSIDATTGLEEVSVDFDNPFEVEVNSSINATATFEQIILDEEILTFAVGKWKIRKPVSVNKAGKANRMTCEVYEVILRADGTYTIIYPNTIVNGTYDVRNVESTVYEIFLFTEGEENYGKIENIQITYNTISFTLISNDCYANQDGVRDDSYVEEEDPYSETNRCSIGVNVLSGPQSQTVSLTQEIETVVYEITTDCSENLNVSSSGLPSGVTASLVNNLLIIAGTPSDNVSGTFLFEVFLDNGIPATEVSPAVSPIAKISVWGKIVVGAESFECTEVSVILIDGDKEQIINLGEPITPIVFDIETNCLIDDLYIRYDLPEGVALEEIENTNLYQIVGTPIEVGTYLGGVLVTDRLDSYFNNILSDDLFSVMYTLITVLPETNSSTTTCAITSALTGGQASQSVTTGQAISSITYAITSDCSQLTANAYNLPPGISLSFNNNIVNLSGTATLSGTYNYAITIAENSTTNSITLSGIITILSGNSS